MKKGGFWERPLHVVSGLKTGSPYLPWLERPTLVRAPIPGMTAASSKPSAWQGAKQSPVSGNDQQWRIQQTEVEVISQRTRHQPLKLGKFDLGVSARWLEARVRQSSRRGVLSPRESALAERIKLLKREAGSHSPSAPTLIKMIPELRLRVDACFLSNPYATDLFLDYLQREVVRTGKLRRLLEFYPSQNRVIANKLSGALGLPPEYLFVGNGAVEIIQAILHKFTGRQDPGEPADVLPLSRVRQARHASCLQHTFPGRRLPVRPGKLSGRTCAASSPTRWS